MDDIDDSTFKDLSIHIMEDTFDQFNPSQPSVQPRWFHLAKPRGDRKTLDFPHFRELCQFMSNPPHVRWKSGWKMAGNDW